MQPLLDLSRTGTPQEFVAALAADAARKNNDGKTACDVARDEGHHEGVSILEGAC